MTFDIKPPLLPELVALHGRWYPNKLAVIDEHSSLTWHELDQRSNAVANGLLAQGLGRGDGVAILMSNRVEYVEVLYGVFKAGAVAVPLNLAVSAKGLAGMMSDAGTRAAFFTGQEYEKVATQLSGLPQLQSRLVLSETDSATALAGTTDYREWRRSQSTQAPRVTIGDDDPCNIIYSSGTTGVPKGIKHLHRRRAQSMYELALAHRYHYGAVAICPIGLYSNIAWASLFCSLIVGGTCVIQKAFDASQWIDAVREHQVTHTMMVPLMFQRVLEARNFRPESVASLQAIISGGSPLYEQLKRQVAEQFRCAVIELYGLTEGFMTTLQPEEAEGRLGSVGKPVRGHDYLIVDDHDQPLPWGATGEICVRSVHWMVEYHNRPDATQETNYIDNQGRQWLRTGDIGRVDEEGYLYIVDRKKDMILSGGQNIYPADIESVMVTHPAVSEVAVIGIADATWGETPIALVVLRAGQNCPDASTLTTWTNERVGRRQKIRTVYFRDDLPRNPNGKILKRELRAEYETQSSTAQKEQEHA
ncbi:class I adenylate-forming enzyme family protein [Parahaliea mediterranea]|uniref:class I adenylate-forming enzyme family protein n=1 Tax=Parahaliea mediterranea TaxID=651086 RepID=UPI000E2F9308|nr:AMP-binding protein [Parahaliea mediterranea]